MPSMHAHMQTCQLWLPLQYVIGTFKIVYVIMQSAIRIDHAVGAIMIEKMNRNFKLNLTKWRYKEKFHWESVIISLWKYT